MQVYLKELYLPEVVDLPVDQRLILSLDVIDVLDVTGIEVLLHNKAQETVVWGVSCRRKEQSMWAILQNQKSRHSNVKLF